MRTKVDRVARLVSVSVLAGALVAPATAASAGATQGVDVRRDVVYRTVGGQKLALDVYLPADDRKNRPAIVLVHGGGWHSGDKAVFAPEARELAELGYVAFSVDYRLAPEHPYPAAVDDVQAAVRWIRDAKQVKTYRIDPERIGALGGSAGGHLVGMLATLGRGSLDRGARVAAAVSWSGPMDFVAFEAETEVVPTSGRGTGAVVLDFLGCRAIDDACAKKAAEASPISHVDKTDAPVLLVNSSHELVPVDQARRMADALEKAGVAHQLLVVPGSRHARALAPTVWDDTVRFLGQYLGKPPPPKA